ncbi:hypothetical protein KI387_013033 [Taxus chinensis]|uniref:Uncharacterized protein n=1 Tax=Taxus chinensis TaxID=29808 RepID=A0AA38FGJ5_TAXCH|nr:hypothetical protein KI387_013033 [Taxus chinensis]
MAGNPKRNVEKKMKRDIAVTVVGTAAIALIAGKALLSFLRRRLKAIPGIKICVNLTASEILNLADRIIAKSKQIYDSVAAVPLDKVSYIDVIVPLAELEAEQFHLVQSCVFPRMVSPLKDVQEASLEAEKKIDSHNVNCSMREDVYRVVKAFAAKGEWLDPEARRYVNHLVRDFERQGLNVISGRRTEIKWLKERIKELCNTFVRNLSEENHYLLFNDSDLAGMPSDFLKVIDPPPFLFRSTPVSFCKDLYPCHVVKEGDDELESENDGVDWRRKIPKNKCDEVEGIIDTRIKKACRMEYKGYLVKLKGKKFKDAT